MSEIHDAVMRGTCSVCRWWSQNTNSIGHGLGDGRVELEAGRYPYPRQTPRWAAGQGTGQ